MNDENETDEKAEQTESLADVTDALESTGAVTPDETDEQTDEESSGGLPGPLGIFENLSGTGKGLESYEDSPIASALGDDDSKGALHIARGVDGLSPLGAMNPIMDIGIGVVLLQLERADKKDDGSGTEVERADGADDPTESRVAEDLA